MMELSMRRAEAGDVEAIVALLADDALGRTRERPGDPAYAAAFAEIDADRNQVLAVAVRDGSVIGTLQISFVRGLSLLGGLRGEIEAVRVASALRGGGVGRQMVGWAIAQCRARGCRLVQLTTNAQRVDAHRFYEQLGFARSHLGFKMTLDS